MGPSLCLQQCLDLDSKVMESRRVNGQLSQISSQMLLPRSSLSARSDLAQLSKSNVESQNFGIFKIIPTFHLKDMEVFFKHIYY